VSSKAYFDDVAGDWDDMRGGFFPDAVREAALRAAGVEPGQLAADIGAGTGFITEALIAAGLNVVAVDQSPTMLDVLAGKFEGVDTRPGTAEALPLADEYVDHAFANMYLHHVEDPAAAIREMARILKPGGRLIITDLDTHEFHFLVEEQHDRWMGFARDDVRGWFETAGLRDVVVDCVGSDCCADSVAGAGRAEVSIFIAAGVKG
jgi:ubiquinone/menaquinone biosynthesis C-methylase UbiE